VRLGQQGRLVVASKEPAWNTDFPRTRVYEVASGSPAGPVMEFPGCIQDAALSGDGVLLAVALRDPDAGSTGVLQVHDVATGERILWSSDLPSAPMSLTWHPTAAQLALVCQDGEVGVASVGQELEIDWLSPRSPVGDRDRFEVAFSSDGERLVSLGPGGKVEVWRPAEGARSRQEIPVAGEKIWSFALSKSGGYLGTASLSGAVHVWDLETCQPAGPVLPHPGWVYRVSFSADEASLVTACHDGRARVWEWGKGALRCQPLAHAEQVLDAAFTPDDRWILTACRDGCVRLWDPRGGETMTPPVNVGNQALGLVVPQDGRHVVVGSLGAPLQVLTLPGAGRGDGSEMDARDLCALGEVLSNGEIREGRYREFNADEWLERFRQVQRISRSGIPNRPREEHDPGLGGSAAPVSSCGRSSACLDCQAWMAAADGTAGPHESGH
jgi:WD40 repeat protein